jgi:NAD(P)-dependent dehydrogenase (short-subunit alcohol dehydrogenase family)
MARLDGRTALVTGASRGIGEAVATRLAAEGATVVIASRRRDGLEAAAARIRAATGPDVVVAPCHTGDLAAIEALFRDLDARGLTVDALVSNAAANPYFGPMIGLDWAAWDKTFEVNLKGTFALCREVARRLVAAGRPGAIVNVASIYGETGAPFQGIYAMTKAAMISLTQTLAQEWGLAGIRVNAIAPGLVDTRFASAIVQNPAFVDVFTSRSALKRYAQPGEIAPLVAYLVSDEASFVTGACWPIDGGYLAG